MKWVFFAVALVSTSNLFAQAKNDNIEDRLILEFQKPMLSSTAGSKVQWKCINKALTNKCLVYHNDQWFTFSVETAGDYFINIASQKCRDSKGVQMIVIEGNPCEVSTYKILECISQIRTEDVFVSLPQLKAGTQYLINIDGFLGDVCEFEITLSDKPRGLPRTAVNTDALKLESRLENKIVSMEWTIDEATAQEIGTFRIFRKLGKARADEVGEMSLNRNAYGSATNKYQFRDTLKAEGSYSYDIYGIRASDEIPVLLSQRSFSLAPKYTAPAKNIVKVLPVRMNFEEHALFQLRLYNYDGDALLWKHEGESQGAGELFMIDPQPYTQYGLRKFQLLVLDGNGNKIDEIYFRVDGEGGVTRE